MSTINAVSMNAFIAHEQSPFASTASASLTCNDTRQNRRCLPKRVTACPKSEQFGGLLESILVRFQVVSGAHRIGLTALLKPCISATVDAYFTGMGASG